MALFDYKCRICGFEFDATQRVGASDFATCPKCSCLADKKWSTFNFSFGFTLSDESRWIPYRKDEFVRNI